MSRIRADRIVDRVATGAPLFPNGAVVTGVATATTFSGNATGLTGTPSIVVGSVTGTTGAFSGNVSVGGTLTYEDVTNIDSIGIITARSGIEFGVSGAGGTITSAGVATFAGQITVNDIINTHRTTSTTTDALFKINSDVGGTNQRQITLRANGDAIFAGTVTDSIGPLRRLGVNAQSGAYAFVVGDAGKIIRSSGSGSALTLNQNIFTAGDMISVFNVGSGNNTVVQGTGVTLYNAADAATGTRTIAAKGMCTIVCTASNEFAISGSQLS